MNTVHIEISYIAMALKKLAGTWAHRAQIKPSNLTHTLPFDITADDFLVALLPFQHHPLFLSAPKEMQSKILSCGWIIYNQKTLVIENEVINPICMNILSEKIPGLTDTACKQVVSQTMIDESYHILLVLNAIEMTNQIRNLSLTLPDFHLNYCMKMLQASYSEPWQKILIQFATAMVSEIFISDYLKLLSESHTVQPINRIITKVHRDDELAHSNIFKHFAKYVYANLSPKQKIFFGNIFAKPIAWFSYPEFTVWQSTLEQIGFKGAKNMLQDCRDLQAFPLIDYSEIGRLAEELGLSIVFDVGRK